MILDYNKVLFFIEFYGTIPIINISVGLFYNIGILVFIIFFLLKIRTDKLYYAKKLIKKHCVYLLDGKTGSGKTRLMTQISSDTKKQNKNTLIIGNYFSKYTDIYFASLEDFKLLQIDIARLGEHINFSLDEKKQIEKVFPGYFQDEEKELFKKIKKIKGKYDFLTLGDEFYAYFHNRNFMSNFSKKTGGDDLLLNLHQTRHSNQTIILASQDDDNLDLDFRQIAHNEINVFSIFLDYIFGFRKYKYLSKKQQKETGLEFAKVGFFPNLFINYYEISKSLNGFMRFLFNMYNLIFYYGLNKLKFKFKKILWKEKDFFKKQKLSFFTKFNVKKSINVYKKGDLYDFIINLEKGKKSL